MSFVETAANKPSISREARERIKAFVKELERLQNEFAVEIAAFECDGVAIRDMRRTDDWHGYGEFDAVIGQAERPGRVRVENVRFESFGLWGA